MTRLADQDARDRIARDLASTLVVEAAAGTGKTSELVRRMVAAIAGGHARLEQMVAVTFTEPAAGELKLRLRSEIERVRTGSATGPAERANLARALPALEEARIGTIHAFCADLLRERPVEAGVDPAFEVAAEDAAAELLDRAFDRWFERQLAAPDEAVRRLVRRGIRDADGPRGMLRGAARELVERRDFPAPWRHAPFDRGAELAALVDEMRALGGLAADGVPDDWLTKSLARLGELAADVERRGAVRGPDADGLEAELVRFARERHWGWKGTPRARHGFERAAVLARRDALGARLGRFVAAAGADLAPKLRDALWEVVVAYEEQKRRAGCLDFLDLLLRARDLVRDDAAVRRDLQSRLTHLLVDEFQDTDPLQAELLLLLAADDPAETDWRRVRPVAGKLFLVGDPKQSIYRFRRADVALYEAVKRQLVAAGGEVLELTVSFRAVPEIQQAVNAAFAPVMDGSRPSQATYVPLSRHRDDVGGRPAVVVVPVPAPYGQFRTIRAEDIERSTPEAVAAFVDWLVRESGWTVTERERPAVRVPIASRHVCLLFRRMRSFRHDVTRPYVRALEARQLPHVLVGGGAFGEREEVQVIRNALAAVERPDDELMVFATLRGPLFALSDAQLLAWRETTGRLHPFQPVPAGLPEAVAEVAAALAVLVELHRGRSRWPFAATIARLLAATRAHAGLAVWPTGEQALANVTRLLDLARRAERRGTGSFRRFVEQLGESEAREVPTLEEGTEGVRLMTVHKAKGLEFPVVVLADPTCRDAPMDPTRFVDPERRLCAMRLAGTSPVELLEHADVEREREREEDAHPLRRHHPRARSAGRAGAGRRAARGLARAARAGALSTASAGRAARAGPLARLPRSATTPAGPSARCRPARGLGVARAAPSGGGCARGRVVGPVDARARGPRERRHPPAAVARSGRGWWARRLRRGRARRVAGGARPYACGGSVPAMRVVTATALAETGTEIDGVDVAVEEVPVAPDRPHGVRFGTLVHAVLAAVDLDADAAAVAATAAAEGRVVGASPDEVAAAGAAVLAALAHPILVRAAAADRAGRCRRETPIGVRLDADRLVEGVVDAMFADEADGAWTVVEFKTDVEVAGRLDAYRRQVALYAMAIGRATGRPVRAVVLRV
ncbi:MAG: UvrD-helicase domain-containing protein [Candidatus Binatia bacterium]